MKGEEGVCKEENNSKFTSFMVVLMYVHWFACLWKYYLKTVTTTCRFNFTLIVTIWWYWFLYYLSELSFWKRGLLAWQICMKLLGLYLLLRNFFSAVFTSVCSMFSLCECSWTLFYRHLEYIAGDDECYDCSFQKKYTREEAWQAHTHSICDSLCNVLYWSCRQVCG